MGGLARLDGYVDFVRKSNRALLYVSAGDMLFGIPDPADYMVTQARYKADWLFRRFPGDLLNLSHRDERLMMGARPWTPTYPVLQPSKKTSEIPFHTLSVQGKKIGFAGLSLADAGELADEQFRTRWIQDVNRAVAAFRTREAPWMVVGLSALGSGADLVLGHQIQGIDFVLGWHQEKKADRLEITENVVFCHLTDSGKFLGRLDIACPPGSESVFDRKLFGDLSQRQALQDDIDLLNQRISKQRELGSESADRMAALLETRRERQDAKLAAMISHAPPGTFLFTAVALDDQISDYPATHAAVLEMKTGLKAVNMAAPESLLVPVTELAFAGQAACAECHERQLNFVKNQSHYSAWDSLVRTHTDGDVSCISCHAAGFSEPGGVRHIKQLDGFTGVQCESCHGPGTAHIQDRASHQYPVVTGETCLKCHTKEHSDERIDSERVELFHCPAN